MNKHLLFFALLIFTGEALTQEALLRLTPERPQPGQLVQFEYDLTRSPLLPVTGPIEVVGVEYATDQPRALPVFVYQEPHRLRGMLTPGPEAAVVLLTFKTADRMDNNQGEGYFVLLHDARGQVSPRSRAAQAALYRDWGDRFDLGRKPTVAAEWFEQAFKADSSLKTAYASSYAGCLLAIKRNEEGKKEALDVLKAAASHEGLPEKEAVAIARLLDRLGASEEANRLRERLKRDYPGGIYARQMRRREIRAMTEFAAIEEAIEKYRKDFPATTEEEKQETGELYEFLASKAIGLRNWEKAKNAARQMTPSARAGLYNNTAWSLAEKGEHLAQARLMAQEATAWAESELHRPQEPRPFYLSMAEWENERRYTFAQYADTYAFILSHMDEHYPAAQYQVQAVEQNKGEEAEINERYTRYLEKIKAPELRHRLEEFILKGKATAAMKEQFIRLYMAEDKSDSAAAAYLAHLEKKAREEQKNELAKKMIDRPAPAFRLKSLSGEAVSSESLRGKVVVLDFWATWCGPCKASFPGMQKAQDLYKNDTTVVFLFVNTWENAANKEKTVADFLNSKGYTFNVLMDNDSQVVAAYGVPGIPTKFVLDKNGRIRFKSVGFSGDTEALVWEVQQMIELTKAAHP